MHRRAHLHVPRNLGERVADRVTAFSGSWPFVGLHLLWWCAWIGLRLEAFPFGLLTMLLSLEAIVLSTLVLMSQGRESRKNRQRDDIESIEVHRLWDLSQQQAVMLAELHALRDELRCQRGCTHGLGVTSVTYSDSSGAPVPQQESP